MVLEYVRKPAVVQRVMNSLINEIVGGGQREAIPADMLPFDERGAARRAGDDDHDDADGTQDAHDTPPFGLGAVAEDTEPGRRLRRLPRPSHRRRRPPPSRSATA